jgi:F-type H+-transporting ATPase subunit gamma
MASILTLKRRINAARNVSKTTKALQMISASKLKRAQDAILSTRPYVRKISEITTNLSKSMTGKHFHPYLGQRIKTNKTLLIVLSPDKGLCGSLITNLVREFIKYQNEGQESSYIVIGKKIEGKIVHLSQEILASFAFGTTLPEFDMVFPILKIIDEYYGKGKVDSVKILTTEYTSVFSQTPKIFTLLPIQTPTLVNLDNDEFYIYEPNREELLNTLLRHYVEMATYQQLIESFVSEQAARMISMQNATDNANDIIEDLQLEYNKTRQAKITSEILDITGGANILKVQ